MTWDEAGLRFLDPMGSIWTTCISSWRLLKVYSPAVVGKIGGSWETAPSLKERLQPFGQRFNSLCKAVNRHDLGPRLGGMPVAWNSDLGTDAVYVKDPEEISRPKEASRCAWSKKWPGGGIRADVVERMLFNSKSRIPSGMNPHPSQNRTGIKLSMLRWYEFWNLCLHILYMT